MISIIDHTSITTQKVVGRFQEVIDVKAGFSGFFPEETTPTLEVDVEVERDNDLIAVDVERFTEGNASKSTKATEHKYIPPYFKQEYYFQRDTVYMNAVAMGVLDNSKMNKLIVDRAEKNMISERKKIQRAIRKQQADVLQFGIVTLTNGDSIDYRRKPASMVVKTGTALWSNPTTAKPISDIAAGVLFLREEGNSNANDINVVMRGTAFNAFMASDEVKQQAEWTNIKRIQLDMPQFDAATGLTFQGQTAAGDFVVNLWTYNEKYTNDQGETVYYLEDENVVIIPSDFQGKTVFGGLVAMTETNVSGVMADVPSIVEANYLIRSFSDKRTLSSGLEMTSAPLVIPFTIDKIFTLKVL